MKATNWRLMNVKSASLRLKSGRKWQKMETNKCEPLFSPQIVRCSSRHASSSSMICEHDNEKRETRDKKRRRRRRQRHASARVGRRATAASSGGGGERRWRRAAAAAAAAARGKETRKNTRGVKVRARARSSEGSVKSTEKKVSSTFNTLKLKRKCERRARSPACSLVCRTAVDDERNAREQRRM